MSPISALASPVRPCAARRVEPCVLSLSLSLSLFLSLSLLACGEPEPQAPTALKGPTRDRSALKDTIARQDCEGEPRCRAEGLCDRTPEGACVAATPRSCLQSVACRALGRCTPQEGVCATLSDLDCQQGEQCDLYGLCVAKEGACVVERERDCERSASCQALGECKLMGDRCVTEEEWSAGCGVGCLRARGTCVCAERMPARTLPPREGQGSAGEGAALTNVACLDACSARGECQMSERGCLAATDAQCERSEGCVTHGRCVAREGRCVTSEEGCRFSLACALTGRCDLSPAVAPSNAPSLSTPHRQVCVTTSEEMCRASKACAEVGLCTFAARPLPDLLPTPAQGLTDQRAEGAAPLDLALTPPKELGDCVFRSDNVSCRDLCARLGRCSPNAEGVCLALLDEECELSEVCQKYGRCSASEGACVAKTSFDCRRGLNCKMFGYCEARAGRCVNASGAPQR